MLSLNITGFFYETASSYLIPLYPSLRCLCVLVRSKGVVYHLVRCL